MFLVSALTFARAGGGLQMQHFLKYQQWLLWNYVCSFGFRLCHVGRWWVEIESLGFRKKNMAGFWDHAGTWDLESCVETDAHLLFSTIFWFLCFPNHQTDSTQIPVNSEGNEIPRPQWSTRPKCVTRESSPPRRGELGTNSSQDIPSANLPWHHWT